MAILIDKRSYRQAPGIPKEKKPSLIGQASSIVKPSMNILKGINQASESLLNESGWLDSPRFSFDENIGSGQTRKRKMFERKPPEGNFLQRMLRKPEDRIQLTQDAASKFGDMSREKGGLAVQHYADFVKQSGEGNDKLLNLVGGEEGIKKSVAFHREGELARIKTQAKGEALLNETMANLNRTTRGADYTTRDPIGVKGDFLSRKKPMLGQSNITFKPEDVRSNIRPDLINPKRSGFRGILPPAKEETILPGITSPDFIPGTQSRIMDKARGLVNSPLMKTALNPEKAIANKAATLIAPKAMSGLAGLTGPAGWAAQMALSKLFKPHTLLGKIFG